MAEEIGEGEVSPPSLLDRFAQSFSIAVACPSSLAC
ncbi:MAG: hypothetical protein RL015_3581 [Verrucomicrobiota bacterium]